MNFALDAAAQMELHFLRTHALSVGIGVLKHPRREPHPCGFFMPGSLYGGLGGEPQGSPVPLRGCPVRQPVWAAAPIGVVTAVNTTAPTEPSMNSHPAAEEWRPISGFPGYEVSSLGRVRSSRGIKQLRSDLKGYLFAAMWRDGKSHKRSVARLVAAAFIGPRPAGLVVRHKNGINTENIPSNLQYGTPAENEADKRGHGTAPIGERHPAAKLTETQVLAIRSRLVVRGSHTHGVATIAREFGVTSQLVKRIRGRLLWAHLPEAPAADAGDGAPQ